jgi:hypothetical protein
MDVTHPPRDNVSRGGLKGWFQTDFEGVGVRRLEAGSCWLQPAGIRHTVVGWSDDCELLEIIVPAQHETVNDP